jgi:hypothetical protein
MFYTDFKLEPRSRSRRRLNSSSQIADRGVIETNQIREELKDPQWADYMRGKTLLGRLGSLKKWRVSLCSEGEAGPLVQRTSGGCPSRVECAVARRSRPACAEAIRFWNTATSRKLLDCATLAKASTELPGLEQLRNE